MTPRDRKIRRIAAVQAKLHRIAEWQLMECQAKEHELQDRQRRIIEGFNEENRLPELAAQTASLNLRAASVERGVIAKAKERLAAHALTEARKLKQVLRIARDVAARAFREQEKRILDDVTDAAARRPAEGSKG
jgi:predicted negative regulator of RcsB-dependent stress response